MGITRSDRGPDHGSYVDLTKFEVGLSEWLHGPQLGVKNHSVFLTAWGCRDRWVVTPTPGGCQLGHVAQYE